MPMPLYVSVRMRTMSSVCVNVALTRHCVVFALTNYNPVCV